MEILKVTELENKNKYFLYEHNILIKKPQHKNSKIS